jgi:hypothetical protein
MKDRHQRARISTPPPLLPHATAVLALLLISACSDRQIPTSLHSPSTAAKNIQLTDWYTCWKYVGDSEWRHCDLVSTTVTGNDASWMNFTNPTYYTTLSQVSVTQTPAAVEPEPQPYIPAFGDDDTTNSSVIPNCNYPDDLDRRDRAWCSGEDPTSSSNGSWFRLNAINRALTKMRALGPPCDAYADDIAAVVGAGHFRFYNPPKGVTTAYNKGGFAAAGQHGNGYVLLSTTWVDVITDENRYSIMWTVINGVQTQVKVDLQFALAHEGEHLHDATADHVDPEYDANGVRTGGLALVNPHSVYCGGLGP